MEDVSEASVDDPLEAVSGMSVLLRRYFPFYAALAALVTFGYSFYDAYQLDGDAVSYMDIGDNMRAHHWAGAVNAYWHPMYPAFLSLGHILFHATRATELHAYYSVNFGIFLLQMLAVVCFTDAIVGLRTALEASDRPRLFLLDRYALRYLGLALLVVASQRELSLGKVRPDALLQAFLLLGIASLLTHLATNRLRYAALMGLALGCAYLTKSFAFLLALLCILALATFRWIWLKQQPLRILPAALVAFACFAALAGPYVAALSLQKGRLTFGDSGALNYAWFVGGTEKMHLQPYQTSQFGSADVHLKHPERELLHSPLILSYAEMPYGTYPDWFDTTYWNDQVKPRFRWRDEVPRGSRNLVLSVRYSFNHPEGLLLLALLMLLGARPNLRWRPQRPDSPGRSAGNPFWLVPLFLGIAVWGIYATVNVEERYVTVAYLSILLSLFATLRLPDRKPTPRNLDLRPTAAALIFLVALLAAGESLRIVFEDRRNIPAAYPGGWYSPSMVHAAQGLESLGVKPGDSVACIGYMACLNNHYWARLAGVRILAEIYDPSTPVPIYLAKLPNREQALDAVRAQGVKVLVGDFGDIRGSDFDPAFNDWKQLGGTSYYALPLNLPQRP